MLQEIASQKGVSCRAQGWKVHLCAAQLLQLVGGLGLPRRAAFSWAIPPPSRNGSGFLGCFSRVCLTGVTDLTYLTLVC